jgi:hypothetical protein
VDNLLSVLANSDKMISPSKRKPLASTSQVVSQMPIKPLAMVSSSVRKEELDEEPNERIKVGNNLSHVQRAMRSQTFKPLPSEGQDEYQKIVDQSIKDASFKPVKEEKKSKSSEYKSVPINPELTEKRAQEYMDFRKAYEIKSKSTYGRIKPEEANEVSVVKQTIEPSKEKRENPIKNAILWASDVSDPNAPSLRETAGIVARQAKQLGKKGVPVLKKAAEEGLHAAKWGVRAVGEVAEEFEKTTMARNMMAQAEAEMHHMRSAGKRARAGIALTGLGNKRNVTAGSLVTQHAFVGTHHHTATFANTVTSNPYGVVGRYERGMGGRVELHYYAGNQRITHEQASRVLTPRQIQQVKQGAKYASLGQQHAQKDATSTTTANANTLVASRKKSVSGLITSGKSGFGTDQSTNPVLNIPKIATPSGLVHRHHSGVV